MKNALFSLSIRLLIPQCHIATYIIPNEPKKDSNRSSKIRIFFFKKKLGFTPCKAEHHYKAWGYKKKKHKKIKAHRKSV